MFPPQEEIFVQFPPIKKCSIHPAPEEPPGIMGLAEVFEIYSYNQSDTENIRQPIGRYDAVDLDKIT